MSPQPVGCRPRISAEEEEEEGFTPRGYAVRGSPFDVQFLTNFHGHSNVLARCVFNKCVGENSETVECIAFIFKESYSKITSFDFSFWSGAGEFQRVLNGGGTAPGF